MKREDVKINKNKKAVALKYPEGCIAPIITAKGEGKTAEIIIEEAVKNNVFITENTEVINFLDNCETGSTIPENVWEAVALIFSFILEEQ